MSAPVISRPLPIIDAGNLPLGFNAKEGTSGSTSGTQIRDKEMKT